MVPDSRNCPLLRKESDTKEINLKSQNDDVYCNQAVVDVRYGFGFVLVMDWKHKKWEPLSRASLPLNLHLPLANSAQLNDGLIASVSNSAFRTKFCACAPGPSKAAYCTVIARRKL
jgi:hypothetical protein